MVNDHEKAVSRIVADLGATASSLRETVESNAVRVSETFDRFDSAAVELRAFASRLDTLAINVYAVVEELRTGEGTLPRLIHSDQLLRRWESAAKELDLLVTDIRANPGKYLKVKVSLF